jgi:hypothetical protein
MTELKFSPPEPNSIFGVKTEASPPPLLLARATQANPADKNDSLKIKSRLYPSCF